MTTNITVTEGAVGLGGIGGVIGFMFAGPIGAAAGAAIGAGLGAGAADLMMKKKLVIPPPALSIHSPPPPAAVQSLIPLIGKAPIKPMIPQPPSPQLDISAQQMAAVAMNVALAAHGYKSADMPLYMAFQRTAGLAVDGHPGKATMNKLAQILVGANVNMASVPTYPWLAAGAYDGVNAPTAQDWAGWSDDQTATFTKSVVEAVPGTLLSAPPIALVEHLGVMPTASQVAAVIPMIIGAKVVTNQDVQRALNQLGIPNPLLVADGIIGNKSIAAIKTFQNSNHLVVDGVAGPKTKAALQTALAGASAYPPGYSGVY
jgi:peptidoglycan hydrolase-like protein with peptidoglycan-binding domain